ncbi:MAG: hypothetical protein RIC55_34955 [Pirellulaceae bacterium]
MRLPIRHFIGRLMVMLFACGMLGLLLWLGGDSAAQTQQARKAEGHANGVSAKQAELHEKLNRSVRLDAENLPASEMLERLEDSLGAKIAIELNEVDREPFQSPRTVNIDGELTIMQAIQFALSHSGLGNYHIALDDDGVRLIDHEKAQTQAVLQTHDLASLSDYASSQRPAIIQRLKREAAPGTWRSGGPFMLPSRSIHFIDVYAPLEVHAQINNVLSQHLRFSGDPASPAGRAAVVSGALAFPNEQLTATEKKALVDEMKRSVEALKQVYKVESLADRLKYEARAGRERSEPELTAAARERLDGRDESYSPLVPGERPASWNQYRAESLRMLHEEEVEKFISREGFGRSRVPPPGPHYWQLPSIPDLPLASSLNASDGREPPRPVPAWPAVAATGGAPLPTRDVLTKLHHFGESSFFDVNRYGYIKDKEHVAGFFPHAFTRAPSMRAVDGRPWYEVRTEQWALRRLELVSLLKHPEPKVYVSDALPRMDKLAEATVRAPGAFEEEALARLKQGEDVIAQATTNRIEMVGSLRAAKECLQCHDVQRGELLGAFSYELIRDPAIEQRAAAP